MARDRRDIAQAEVAAQTAALPLASPADRSLAATRTAAQRHEALLALVRAMARDAARTDHASGRDGDHAAGRDGDQT